MSKLISVGQIVNTHGIKGAVKVKPYLLSHRLIGLLNPLTDKSGHKTFDLKLIGHQKECLIVQIAGVSDRNTAETLKGIELFALRSKLPITKENEFYYTDLIGLHVINENKTVGVITRVDNFGAGDIVEILFQNGKTVPFSFCHETFPHVDLNKGTIELVIPMGMEEIL